MKRTNLKRSIMAIVIAVVSILTLYVTNPGEVFGLRPKSDLMIQSDLGWWPNQEGLVITEFSAEAVSPNLNLFNHEFIARYHARGTIRAEANWRPTLCRAQITARSTSRITSPLNKSQDADIVIVPIIDVAEDDDYAGGPVPFDVTVQQVVHTMGWGKNIYVVRCGDRFETIEVLQSK